METTKLTPEELAQLQDFQEQNQAVALEFGNLEITNLQVQARKAELTQFYQELKTKEQELGKELSAKYGNGTIDLEKGEFQPAS